MNGFNQKELLKELNLLVRKTLLGGFNLNGNYSSRKKSKKEKPLFSLQNSKNKSRLKSDFEVVKTNIEYLKEKAKKKPKIDTTWLESVKNLEVKIEKALDENRIDEGWKGLHSAKQMLIYGLDENELDVEAESIRQEAESKLKSWRKKTVDSLLNEYEWNKKKKIEDKKDSLYKATKILHEDFDNQYYKIGLKKSQFIFLFFVLLANLLILLFLSIIDRLPSFSAPVVSNWEMLLAVMLFGILGASVSASISLAQMGTRKNIPDLIAHNTVTMMRILIGAGSAVAIYTFVISGLITYGSNSTALVLAISFISGWTERFIKRAVESVAGSDR